MGSKLLIESGSSKTNWVIINTNDNFRFQSIGINPRIQSSEQIIQNQISILNEVSKTNITEVYYYGAGIVDNLSKNVIDRIFREKFENLEHICIESDLLAACYSTFGKSNGLVGILGTGSNCCYFDGQNVIQKSPSLGYVLGDEGSGSQIGKQILKYYFYNMFDHELKEKFEDSFEIKKEKVFKQVYGGDLPNRYLASFAKFAIDNQNHYMIQNILEDEFINFMQFHLFRYSELWQNKVSFVGSIAYHIKEIICPILEENGILVDQIIKDPIEQLIAFHS